MSSTIIYVNLRYVLAFLLLAVIVLPQYVHADGGGQLGTKLIPGKIMENTDGIMQVYSQTEGVSTDKLIATSSDSSVIQILGIENDKTHATFNVKIKSMAAGIAKIALAAPGFSSQEVPITVYKNTAEPSQLLIKTIPNTFSTNGPTQGYLAVEVTNNDGIPTPAPSDIPITLISSDNKIAYPESTQSVIKQGSYYVVEKFDISQPGTAQLSASSPSMQPVSTQITVTNGNTQNTVQVYVYPQTLNAINEAYAYAVVQLHDPSGNPVLAKEDIPIQVQITNPGIKANNTSDQSPVAQLNQALVIKKGSYWGYAPIEITSGINGTLIINISTKGYLVSGPAQLTTLIKSGVMDDKTAKMDVLPILATGQQELIGIMHLQDANGNPILAKSGVQISVDSSDTNSLNTLPVNMDTGSQAAPVFAYVGSSPNPVTLNIANNAQIITPTITLPPSNSPTLYVDSLVSKILTHYTFPLAVYMTNNGAFSAFTNNFNILVSPQDIVQISKSSVSKDQGIFTTDATLLKDGSQTISVTTPSLSSSVIVEGLSSKPQKIGLDYRDKIISNIKNLFSIELLDGQGSPMLADKDMQIQLVSSDTSVVNVPDSISISKGSYYTTFEADSKKSGGAQISVLTDEIPLSTFQITVTSFTPDLKLVSTDYIDPNYHFDATLTATYQNVAIPGLGVIWTINGAKVQNMDTVTDKDGNAKISLISSDPKTVSIQASVSGGSFATTVVSKQVQVNPPLQPAAPSSEGNADTRQNGFSIMGINPLFFVIPVAAGIAILVLKKREMLEGISEKISIADKFSGIKERMSELRQK